MNNHVNLERSIFDLLVVKLFYVDLNVLFDQIVVELSGFVSDCFFEYN